jgi:hypothetical protein
MVVEQTVDVPQSREVRLVAPKMVPTGPATVIWVYSTVPAVEKMPEHESGLSPTLQKALDEARGKRLYNQSHQEELHALIERVQSGPPIFGGIDGVEYQRKIRDEWEDRLGGMGLSTIKGKGEVLRA